ncbi:MAG TPA: TAT-variant-translocated molybdopterin oxidoreductase, partial [Candidatus Eisenbacteria bacterium]|nr:TAT-variant-translocated molybdopterin oxidoreductase [Candidatus Eisenbacteria bacterium]
MTGTHGKEFWRSLAEREGGDPFAEFVRREYPSQVHKLLDPPERREFLKVMGASFALAGLGASCTRQPKETILPYAKNPESTIPGKPRYFATSMPWPTGAIGILVESHEGRPTKIEGNPDHPASLGATDAITQASILGLYDPDRSKTIKYRGEIRTWDDFLTALNGAMSAQAAKEGAGLRILTETVTSPTLDAQIHNLLAKYPGAQCIEWEPVHRNHEWVGIGYEARPRFDKAEVVLSFGADFLGGGPESVRASRDFMRRRSARESEGGPHRLYMAETAVSLTGACSDHRLPLKPSEIEALARTIEERLRFGIPPRSSARTPLERWTENVLKDLLEHRGRSIVVAGPNQSPAVHWHVLNANLFLG